MTFHRIQRYAWLLIAIVCVPLCVFFVIFDVTKPAYKFDEEYNGLRQVALGPQPRRLFCKPSYDVHYDGTEWPFRVFKPLCAIWRDVVGYAPPKQ